jgi:hypothetical protein
MENNATLRENSSAALLPRTTTRKIGGTTFTVISRVNGGKSRDLAATVARLIEGEADKPLEPRKKAV